MDRPHEDLYRANPDFDLRSEGDGMPTLTGRFAAPGEWTEIRSAVEGNFFERTAPTAFDKTIQESKEQMRVLFHHGMDPRIGMQVLGKVRNLTEDTAYEVPLYDTPEIRSLLPGLNDGQYGSSYKFSIVKEDTEIRPVRSEWNPKGLPQVTILEAKVREFGPTPLPAYPGTSAGLRSITDEFVLRQLQAEPDRLFQLVEAIRAAALQDPEPEASTPQDEEPQHSAEPKDEEGGKPSWHLS